MRVDVFEEQWDAMSWYVGQSRSLPVLDVSRAKWSYPLRQMLETSTLSETAGVFQSHGCLGFPLAPPWGILQTDTGSLQ